MQLTRTKVNPNFWVHTKEQRKAFEEGTQAQLEDDQKVLDACEKEAQEKVKEIFKEIDVQMPKKHYEDEGFHHAPKECKLCWYLALKQKYLNEEGKQKLTTKEFLALPIVKRRKLLQEQANDPEIILYYLHILWDEMAMQDKGMMD